MHTNLNYDPAHEADMAQLRKEQLEADCGGEMADEDDDWDSWPDELADYVPLEDDKF